MASLFTTTSNTTKKTPQASYVSSLIKPSAIKPLNTPVSGIKASTAPLSTKNYGIMVNGVNQQVPAVTGATNTQKPVITPATQTKGTSITSPAGQQYVAGLTTTPQQPAYDNVSGSLTDYGRSQGMADVNAPKVTTPTATAQPKSQGAYIDYLKTLFNPEQVKLAQQSKESALQRAATAKATSEKAQLDARKGVEANLDREGGLKSGAQQSAQVYSRRAGEDIADLALAETAAARSAEIANDTYNTYINAGKSVYEAETAAEKVKRDEDYRQAELNKGEGFSLNAGQSRYDAKGNLIAGGSSSVDDEGSKLLTATEAQLLGVPYGTTRSQAYGSSATGKPTAEQSKARQFAVSAKNANDILTSVTYSPGAIQLPGPNLLKSAERQQFEQASRAFVNAVLRRESGATITDDEFNNKFKELIDQPGDAGAVKAQKKLARDAAVISIQEAGGEGMTSTISPDEESFLRSKGYSDAQIKSLTASFKSVGNTSGSNLSKAIASQESNNNYNAQNKDSGALGKYQMMPATLKGLGYNVNPQQFLSNPSLQEEAHSKLIAELDTRYKGNIDKMLADYYGGPKAANLVGTQAGNTPQNGYPSINQYVAQVKQKLNIA